MDKPVPIKVYGRTHYACTRCKVSKIKCSGEKPACSNCNLVGKGDVCVYPSKDRKIVIMESEVNRLHERVRILEEQVRSVSLENTNPKKDFSNGESASFLLPPHQYTLTIIHNLNASYNSEFYLIDMPNVLNLIDQAYAHTALSDSLAYIFLLLAFGEQVLFSKEEPGLKYFEIALQMISLTREVVDVEFIQTALFLALYSANSSRYNAVYNFIGIAARSALGQGFHRRQPVKSRGQDVPLLLASSQQENSENSSPGQVVLAEKTKRLWWTVFVVDTIWALKTVNFQYTDTDVDLPMENYHDLHDGFDSRVLELNVHLAKYAAKLIRLIYGPNIRTFLINYINTSQFNQKQLLHNVGISLHDLIRNYEIPLLAQFSVAEIVTPVAPQLRALANLFLRYNHLLILITKPLLLIVFDELAVAMIRDFKVVEPTITKSLLTACSTIDLIAQLFGLGRIFVLGYWDSQHCYLALLLLLVAALHGKVYPQINKAIALLNYMLKHNNINAKLCISRLQDINATLLRVPEVHFTLDLSVTVEGVALGQDIVDPQFAIQLEEYTNEKWKDYRFAKRYDGDESGGVLATLINEIQEFN